jgi:hypothetical protein
MKAQVFNHQYKLVAELDNLPNKLHQAAEDFDMALQEAVIDGRGFDAVMHCKQIAPLRCEATRRTPVSNHITLKRTATGWVARSDNLSWPEMFGSDTLPTGFGPNADPNVVLEEIRRLNPTDTVVLEDDHD